MKKRQKQKTYLAVLLLGGGVGLTSVAQAALHDRGGGLIYDDLLDITWLQDANYAKTSGHHASGLMVWDSAAEWAADLSYYDSDRDTVWDDWRLPTVGPVDGSAFDYNNSSDGSTDIGSNISAPGSHYPSVMGSELAHMFYITLGNRAYIDTSGESPQPGWDLANHGKFYNLKFYNTATYWSGTVVPTNTNNAWYFRTGNGSQNHSIRNHSNYSYYAWAVRSGDVNTIPIPAAAWLFGSGLIGLVGIARRRRTA